MKKIAIHAANFLVLLCTFSKSQAQSSQNSKDSSIYAQTTADRKSLTARYLSKTNSFYHNPINKKPFNRQGSGNSFSTTVSKGGVEGVSNSTTESAPRTQSNVSCVTRNVELQGSYYRQPLFDQNAAFIYPGALFDATDLATNQVSNFSLPANLTRLPYDISADLFTMTGMPASPVETIGDNGESFSASTYTQALALILNRNAAATPTVDANVEYIEANSQEEVAIKLGYSLKASIPAELSMILAQIPVGANIDLGANGSTSVTRQRSRIIMKINYSYFTVTTSPRDMNSINLISQQNGAQIPTNLVYVSSVLYGATGFIYFESDKSATELQATLNQTVGIAGPLEQGTAEQTVSAETKAKFSSTVTRMLAAGRGFPVNGEIAVTNLEGLLNLIGTLRPWSANNYGKPIAYTMNFVVDNAPAVVSYESSFQNEICTAVPQSLANMKFDVDLELDHFDVRNVRDLDGGEDLYGKLAFTYLKAGRKEVNADKTFWEKSENNANENSYRNGIAAIDKRINLIRNLSLDELKHITLYIAGKIQDDESVFASRDFKCHDCNEFTGIKGKRKMYFIEMPSTQNSINSLPVDGEYHALKFGEDNYLELNFYESDKKEDGWIKTKWKVLVKAHE